MRKFLLALVLASILSLTSTPLKSSSSGTFFQVYVPPNGSTFFRPASLIITALNDSTYVQLADDNMDGDSDDSWSGLLNKGQSYICYIRDGAINDDYGGKIDGDYFLIYSDKPCVVSQSTNSDWQHDWVPADNGTMRGNLFYIYSPPTSVSIRDINVFAYLDSTYLQIFDITTTPKTTTGVTGVNVEEPTLVVSKYISTKQEIINYFTDGRDILTPGKTFMVKATKPVTVQYGSLFGNARDGGGFVPGFKGSTVDSLFYFAIPADYSKEQELRIVSFTNNSVASFDYLSNGSWVNISNYTINALEHRDWLAGNGQNFPLFRFVVNSGKVALFEANWLETGGVGTSDEYSFCSSENGDGAGQNYVVYMAPPGNEGVCLDPFTNKRFNQLSGDGQFTHAFIYSNYANNTVRIYDTDGNGSVFDTTILIQEKRYYDFKIWKARFNQMLLNGKRPYITIAASQPVAVAMCNWNDNWMCYANTTVKREVLINTLPGKTATLTGDTTLFTSVIKNVSGSPITQTKTEVVVADGLNVVSSNLTSSSSGNLGEGTKTTKTNGEEVIKWTNYPFNAGDSLVAKVVVRIDTVYHDGSTIPNNTNLTSTTTNTGFVNGDTVTYQNTAATMVVNPNATTYVQKYLAAFEDLKNDNWNDWDVNDLVVGITRRIQTNEDAKIFRIVMDYEALARGASYDHSFNQLFKLNGNSTVSLEVRDTLGNIIPNISWGPVSKTGTFSVTIFPSTRNAIPSAPGLQTANTQISQTGVMKGYTATLSVIIDANSNPYTGWQNAKDNPFIINPKTQTVHIATVAGTAGNTQSLDNSIIQNVRLYGYYLDLALKMPYNWRWPLEGGNPIWKAYTKVEDYIISGKTNFLDWYLTPDSTKVWNRRVVPSYKFDPPGSPGNKPDGIFNQSSYTLLDTAGKFFASPKIADIDGDGFKEVMIGSLENKFYAYKHDGTILPGFPYTTTGMIKSSAAIDLSGGNAKIYFGCDDKKLYGIDKNGNNLPGFPVSTNGPIKSSPVVTDINFDKQNDIVVQSGDGFLYAYNSSGNIMSGFPVKYENSIDAFGYMILMPSPAVVDLDKKGSKDIIVASYDSTLLVYDYLGRIRSGFPIRLDNIIYSSPVVVKMQDGAYKIIVATGGGTVYKINPSGVIESSINLSSGFISSPVPVDLNKDGKMKLLLASQTGEIFYLDISNGLSLISSFKTVSDINSSPLIADVNNDGYLEAVYASMNGFAFVMDRYGNMDEPSTGMLSPFSSWVFSSPAISDIDNNGKLDVVFASYDKTIGSFEFSGTNSNTEVYWSSFGRDLGNTRLAGTPDSVSSITDGLGAVFNYFNPVKEDFTTFRIEAPSGTEKIDLKIFDLGGEKVKELTKTNFVQNGIFWEYKWDLRNEKGIIAANGAYIYKVEITVNGKTYSKIQKLAIVR